MENIQYELVDNALKAEDFIRLKVATGFIERPLQQVENALENLVLICVLTPPI